jgi:mono/diheme cytochrome c family protein
MKIFAMVMLVGVWSAGPPDQTPLKLRQSAEALAKAEGRRYAQDQAPAAAPTGDAKLGQTLFDQTYRCYACHGYAGETGSPRLVPMSRTEDSFTAYVRKPSTPGMPPFSDVPAKDLADVYAYLRSLRSTAPAAASIPLLSDILKQIQAK